MRMKNAFRKPEHPLGRSDEERHIPAHLLIMTIYEKPITATTTAAAYKSYNNGNDKYFDTTEIDH